MPNDEWMRRGDYRALYESGETGILGPMKTLEELPIKIDREKISAFLSRAGSHRGAQPARLSFCAARAKHWRSQHTHAECCGVRHQLEIFGEARVVGSSCGYARCAR